MASSGPVQPVGTNVVAFPSSEPHQPQERQRLRRPMPATKDAAAPTHTHTRSTSFFSSFRSRNISAASAPPQQASINTQTSTSTMAAPVQQQPAYNQQPLPPVPTQATTPSANMSPQQPQKPQASQLHPGTIEIRSVVGLKASHAHKVYFSGPLVKRVERQPDGQKPANDHGWVDIWAQLGGTILSIWDMKEVQEASRLGKEVPPTYLNVTDAFVQVLGSVTIPATPNTPARRFTNVLTLNTAGSNLLLFSCPSAPALISWATALRLAAWEKSRLEEIYTAHLIRITLPSRDAPTTLIRGRLEGWARIRIAGQTDWKRVWVSIAQGDPTATATDLNRPVSRLGSPSPGQTPKKHRISKMFSSKEHQPTSTLPSKATITMYAGMKPKERKKALLTMTDVTQAFGVYPERPELITRSTLIKVEGLLGDEELAGSMKTREGWILVMPELDAVPQQQPNANLSKEMLKWIIGLHDAFGLYGRPAGWTWDPRDPSSLMFGYPVGPNKEHLFLDRELVENMDPRDDRTFVIRSRLRDLLVEFMRSQTVQHIPPARSPQQGQPSNGTTAPALPPINGQGGSDQPKQQSMQSVYSPQIPAAGAQDGRPLTPITEAGSMLSHSNAGSMDPSANGNVVQRTATLGTTRSSGLGHSAATTANDQKSLLNGGDMSQSSTPLSAVNEGGSQALGAPATVSDTSYFPPMGGPGYPSPSGTQAHAPIQSQANGLHTPTSPPASSIRPLSPNRKPVSPNSSVILTSSPEAAFQQSPRLVQQTSPTLPSGTSTPLPLTPHLSRTQTSLSLGTSTKSDSASNLSYAKEDELFNQNHVLNQQQQKKPQSPPVSNTSPTAPPALATDADDSHDFTNEAGALFFMQNNSNNNFLGSAASSLARKPVPVYKDDAESDSPAEDVAQKSPSGKLGSPLSSPNKTATEHQRPSGLPRPVRQGTPMAFVENRTNASVTGINSASQAPALTNELAQNINEASFHSNSPPPASISARYSPNPESTSPRLADRTTGRGSSTLANLGRKPSGARAPQPVVKGYSGGTQAPGGHFSSFSSSPSNPIPHFQAQRQLVHATEEASDEGATTNDYDDAKANQTQPPTRGHRGQPQYPPHLSPKKGSSPSTMPPPSQPFVQHRPTSSFDNNDEVLAALAYLDVGNDQPPARAPVLQSTSTTPVIKQSDSMKDEGYTSASNNNLSGLADSSSGGSTAFKSSFAPSRNAEERKKKAQALQAAQQAATTRPGRAGGKKKRPPVVAGTWGDDSEDSEEDEDEEEEDDDVDSDGGAPANAPPRMQQQMRGAPGQQLPQQAFGAGSVYPSVEHPSDAGYSHLRPPRNLPQVPGGGRSMNSDEYNNSQQSIATRRQGSDQLTEGGGRRTYYDDGMGGQPTRLQQGGEINTGAARQTVWSQVLDNRATAAPFQSPNDPVRDTFVQLESETMTKAFTPQGLLSAGLQDKNDRSAKRQEELARETGASLINVPNKPPPPQTGLLGAITAHERERKREGGVGATLTEREREKRVAEERQRRFDEAQRAQLDQMQQGSVYGGPGGQGQFGMMNPMMNPMMMGGMMPMMTGGGMNPMMTGGGMNPMMAGGGMNPMMGYGMMGGFNPHMFAAQQAAQAYQQAMMAFSVAGSQVGGEGGQQGQGPLNPNMTGGGNFDPRMSMAMGGMGMMGPQMGGMGMMGGPMGMQMTGGMDPRFSVAGFPGNGMGGPMPGMGGMGGMPGAGGAMGESGPMGGTPPQGLAAPGPFNAANSRTASPVGRGSPLARGNGGTPNDSRGVSRSTSPKA